MLLASGTESARALAGVSGTSGAASDVTYGFDSDGLTTSATLSGGAALGLAPNDMTSVLDSTRVSGLALRYGYNPYAELTSAAAWYGTDTLYAARYERDNLGRITRIVETTAGTTSDRGYGYDVLEVDEVRDVEVMRELVEVHIGTLSDA